MVWRIADLFVFPTSYRDEAQPLVVLEALARGLPALASRRGAIMDVLPPAWLLDADMPPDGPRSLAARVAAFVDADRVDLARKAFSHFERSRASGDDLIAHLTSHVGGASGS